MFTVVAYIYTNLVYLERHRFDLDFRLLVGNPK